MECDNRAYQNQYRRNLIQEFRTLFACQDVTLPIGTEAVIILSADSKEYLHSEDKVRIEYGIDLIRRIVTVAIGGIRTPTQRDIIMYSPILILNGASEQLPLLTEFAVVSGFPEKKILGIDCGAKKYANTKTQIEAINNTTARHVTFVSSSYHIPRVRRTIKKNLNSYIMYDIVSVPFEVYPYNFFKIRGEIRRIEDYSALGHISRE